RGATTPPRAGTHRQQLRSPRRRRSNQHLASAIGPRRTCLAARTHIAARSGKSALQSESPEVSDWCDGVVPPLGIAIRLGLRSPPVAGLGPHAPDRLAKCRTRPVLLDIAGNI